ncbi:hypothetical protein E1A91_D08G115000v1, partial [Gossypium mustelinum]
RPLKLLTPCPLLSFLPQPQFLNAQIWKAIFSFSAELFWYTFSQDGHNLEDSKQSTADMSVFVQNLLQQMQSRFQTMSESIITKNILFVYL